VLFVGLFFIILLQKVYEAGKGDHTKKVTGATSIGDGIFAMIFMLAAIFWWDV
jgi:hypothetical protein